METVGIRELKAQLSSYVRRAGAGESIVITERGRPIARLSPPTGATALDSLIEAGVATRAHGGRQRPTPHPIKIASTISDLVADQRR
jgi:prevent-host-death family protein